MKMIIPNDVLELMHVLRNNGFECYVVGGAIRSFLLDLPIHDYDLTTNATPQQMQQRFKGYKTIETGLQHGTLTVLSGKRPVEITTYRKDATYQDHRHPDAVEFTSSIQEDCARRDFTINALCYNDEQGLLDFYNGQQDIKNHVVRCIRNPKERFNEDALRILRAIRFASRLGFTIEENTSREIFANKQLLHYVSIERIQEELKGILISPNCASFLNAYKEVFAIFLPQLEQLPSFNTLVASLQNSTPNYIVRLALLFTNFSNVDEELKRMKYSKVIQKEVLSCITQKEAQLNTKIELRHFLSNYAFNFETYLEYRYALNQKINKAQILTWYREIQDNHDCISLKQLTINGSDLKQLGYQGKQISDTLKQLLDAIIEEKVSNTKNDLQNYLKKD